MTPRKILLIQGHPDNAQRHLCHGLEGAYADGARTAGHAVRCVDVATLDFPMLRSQQDWELGPVPVALKPVQNEIIWSDHLVFFFPLWLGDMPALLKAFLEQIARPGFAFARYPEHRFGRKALTGRSARVVVTMGMPATLYRWYFRAHSIKSLERNILGFVGIGPIHETLVGMVERVDDDVLRKLCAQMHKLGVQAA